MWSVHGKLLSKKFCYTLQWVGWFYLFWYTCLDVWFLKSGILYKKVSELGMGMRVG